MNENLPHWLKLGNDVYVFEISDSMIELLEKRNVEGKTQNFRIMKVDSSTLPLDSGFCDMPLNVNGSLRSQNDLCYIKKSF